MDEKKTNKQEETLVIQAQQGSQEALDTLFRKYHNLAFYIALHICHCDADAEDIVQESFIEVSRSIKNLQEPKYFKAWLNRIIFSKSTKLFRKNKDILMSENDLANTNNAIENRRYLLPEKEFHFQSDADILKACIDQLPDKMREVLFLMYFEQMSIKEIAFACDTPEGTVKSRLSYAKKHLKEIIKNYECNNNHKITFSGRALEAAIVSLFAKEAVGILPFPAIPKAFSFSFKGHVVEPSMMLMATLTTCATVGATAVVYPIISDAISTSNAPPLVQPIQTIQEKQSSTFTPIVFQGETIKTEKKAYQVLTQFAHCEIELLTYDETKQQEAKALYEAMKQHGGAYYELLKNRNYYK